jgi:imidazolonepropionase-like amidohydrolase
LREVELLVEAASRLLEAVKIATLNGAKFLGEDTRIGSIAVGKQADLMVVKGNPAANISDIGEGGDRLQRRAWDSIRKN